MRSAFAVLLLAVSLACAEVPPDERPFVNAPDAAGIEIDPSEGTLNPYGTFTISFPTEMVPPSEIDAAAATVPIAIRPPVESEFTWRTQSRGELRITGPLIPGQEYRFRLRDGLKDLNGKLTATEKWGARFFTEALRVSSDSEPREQLSARPQIPLAFNFPMRLAGLPETIWFQNRSTRQKFPCEILLNRAEGTLGDEIVEATNVTPPMEFRVRPLAPLPVGATYDLVVDSPRSETGNRSLPYPRVFPLGSTRPLGVKWVAAKNDPTGTPCIEIKFSAPLADQELPASAIKIEPPIDGVSLVRSGEFLFLTGKFDTTKRYRVEVPEIVMGDRGYTLAAPSVWGATFRPKPSSLLFPEVSEIRQRGTLGLRFAFKHCRTGPVTWRLVRVPLGQLTALRTATERPTSLLPSDWQVLATGEFPSASDDSEQMRLVEWKPTNGALTGPAIFEAQTTGTAGQTIANRVLILFNESALTQKTSPDTTTVRLADMATGKPVADRRVRAVTDDLTPVAEAKTNSEGSATFDESDWMGASWVLAGDEAFPADPGPAFPSGYTTRDPRPKWVGAVFSDRPLYRPGDDVFFKGILREQSGSDLTIRENTPVTWEIVSESGESIASGSAKSDAGGGWDGKWTSPAAARLGAFQIRAKVGDRDAALPADFRIEEYRNPPFSVVCEPIESDKPGISQIKVSSRYFHGAPNIGSRVRWTAQWVSDHDGDYVHDDDGDGFDRVDRFSEGVRAPAFDFEVEGEGTLGPDGTLTLTSEAPFRDPGNRARCTVLWQADVTGPDGQTIIGGADQKVVMNAVTLGVKNSEQLTFELDARPRDTNDKLPEKVRAELFLVKTRSIKERLAPNVYRYRNTDVFTRVAEREVPPLGKLLFDQTEPGRYVLTVSPLAGQPGMLVSTQAYLAAPGEAELPIQTEQSLTVTPVEPNQPALVGSKAKFRVLAPGTGVAWVTVETDRVLDQYTVAIDGNSSLLEVPIKATYEPNATLSVYLLRPGKTDALPAEMFGFTPFRVERRDSRLTLEVSTEKADVRPGDSVRGIVKATAEGQPVPDANVAVFAVDDSVLALGNWTLPKLAAGFLSPNPFAVITCAALTGFLEKFEERSLTQKGFTVGGGGKDEFGNVEFARKSFRALILWEPNLRTDANGIASFSCEAPDNLTRFRVIALGQTARNQFGSGDTTFTVSKDLLIEPALPRFLRQGDEVELRAVSRQRAFPEMAIQIACQSSLSLSTPGPREVSAAKDVPVIARFTATVPTDATTATVTFSASGGNLTDAVESALPILSPTIVVRESTAGRWTGPAFATASGFDPAWKTGTYDTILSTSPFITRLLGLPFVLDYPHGCLEQQSSRILAYTAMAKVLDAVPVSADRDAAYQKVIEGSLKEFERSLLPDGFLPYWPNATDPNVFVTIQTAWAVAMASESGYSIPEDLANKLPDALNAIVHRQTRIAAPATLRAFAFYVLAQSDSAGDLANAAQELYIRRDELGDEGRAFLALGMNALDILPAEQKNLIKEFSAKPDDRSFDPLTFSSTTRTTAICALARATVFPDSNALANLPDTSAALSTQENLWLLLALDSQRLRSKTPPLGKKLQPEPAVRSVDTSAGAWDGGNLAQPFTISGLPKSGHFVLTARRSLPPEEQVPVSRGMSLDRVVRNLTDPKRTGSPDSPFRLGDEVLISYRMTSEKAQSFIALEDPLPAGMEVINPNLAMFGALYPAAGTSDIPAADLSHAEMRDDQTNLYFDSLSPGLHSYAVLARATSVGRFAWPSAQMSPMYDARFTARSAPTTFLVVE
ncbi:MAG: alpha-2-macroglobulin family protein [Terrimicrobiaceae bacterium]